MLRIRSRQNYFFWIRINNSDPDPNIGIAENESPQKFKKVIKHWKNFVNVFLKTRIFRFRVFGEKKFKFVVVFKLLSLGTKI